MEEGRNERWKRKGGEMKRGRKGKEERKKEKRKGDREGE